MELYPETNAAAQFNDLFQHVVHDMKRMMPMWEEFIVKTNKLSISLRSTVVSLSSFLDTLQKIADIATGARGATKEIGSGLTRLCLRHRNIENKLKLHSSGLIDEIASSIQEKLEEWKRSLILLDKDHSKDHKKTKQELRKMSAEVIALQNKVRKGKPEAQIALNDVMHDLKNKTYLFEESEKLAVRSALVEERTRFCVFISCLKPVMDMEISVLSELTHIQEVVDCLCMQAGDPSCLPASSEQVISDIQEAKTDWFYQASPLLSKHCSFQSICSTKSSPTNDASLLQLCSDDITQKLSNDSPSTVSLSLISNDSGFVGQDFASFNTSMPEKWKPVRQRSWTGLAQFRLGGQDVVQKATTPPTQMNSMRVPGRRKKCPDIKMVDDLPFRPSAHAHSLPPTPNPYAIPSILNRIDGNCMSLRNFKAKSQGGQHQRLTTPADMDALQTGVWTDESLVSFDDESSYSSLMQELRQNSSVILDVDNAECDVNSTDNNLDVDELTAAMQELEWTTAMLDNLNNPSYDSKHKTHQEISENEELCISSDDHNSLALKNISKPPISGITRRGSMQGGRKPPPPIRRTSSVTGSPQAHSQSLQGVNASGLDSRPENTPGDPNHQTSSPDVASTNCAAVSKSSRCAAPTSGWLPPGRDDRHANGRRIPRINCMMSQSFGRNASEDEKQQGGGHQKGSSRLPRRSLSETHAEIIQTLNEQFSPQPKSTLNSSENHPSQPAVRSFAGKPSLPNKSGIVKSPELACQIPEGVMAYKAVVTSFPTGINEGSS